jgi:hypothetical protein
MILRPEMVSDNDPHAGPLPLGLLSSTSTVLLQDLFAGTNGTNLTAHTMNVGPGWTAVIDGFVLNGNGTCSPTAATEKVDVSDSLVADVDASVTVKDASLAAFGCVIIRYQDSSNYWMASLDMTGGAGFQLYEKVAGSFVARATTPFTPGAGTSYVIELKAKGANFTGYIGGVSEWTFSSTDFQAATKCGIRSNTASSVLFSNFQVAVA